MAVNAKQVGARVNVASGSIDDTVRPTHPTTVRMLAERGVTLARDESQPLSDHLVAGADLVLVMTAEHARSVVGRFRTERRKVFALAHLVSDLMPPDVGDTVDEWLNTVYAKARDYSRNEQWDIQDPISESDTIYQAVEIQIDNATSWLANVLAAFD